MTKRQTQVSFFASLCLFLSAVEYAIPKPLPFMRLGLANLPLLLALRIFSPVDIFLLIGLKILGQALISGTLFSYVFVFSASGSIASGAAMFLLYNLFAKKNKMSNIGLCLAGSLSNNAAQLAVSRFLIFGENTKYIAPLLFTSGLISALLLGIFSNVFCKKSKWYDALLSGNVNFFCKANEASVASATGVEDGASR
ncbi:MAG: Gx transporter family protein, partial [Treponema sp.]|nr:Gx transporter family protein [Treponema sp.]